MRDPVVVVCVATKGRPAILARALGEVARQTLAPREVLVCPSAAVDVDMATIADLPLRVRCVEPASGLTAQRNRLLAQADHADIVLFIDDDFILAEDYVESMVAKFREDATIVCLTGKVLADGATTAGIMPDEALAILRDDARSPGATSEVFNAYGCNMALRWSSLRGHDCWFDEKLPLYGWLEDVDFSRQAAAFGTIRRYDAMRGVHLGVKQGRISGVRFGYSQTANQLYLARKGSVTVGAAVRKTLENVAANLYGMVAGNDAYIDRRGRLRGNVIGLVDCLFGRAHPLRVLDL